MLNVHLNYTGIILTRRSIASANSDDWINTDWKKKELRLNILQYKIYAAELQHDKKKVRRLQKTILNSFDCKKLAVRKVTQLNRGKKTAGVDGIKNLSYKKRIELANNLKIRGRADPVRKVFIPKPDGTKRPLGIPTMYDRALQALFVMALEPEFEATFEKNSYGFRPGRSPIDAMKQIQLSLQQAEKFVLDADIEKCFDEINHEKLIKLVGHKGKIKAQILAWLKSGNLFDGIFEKTETGTPQGGIISPLLANIALNGLEERLRSWSETQKLYRPNGKPLDKKTDKRNALTYVRHADDFVIMHHDIEVVKKCENIVNSFLFERGLNLSKKKTQIVHTKDEYEGKKPGFDFLGFRIKHFSTTKRSAKTSHKVILGYRLLIYPSNKSRKKHFSSVDRVLRRNKTSNQSKVIKDLNLIISGWINYFRYSHILTTKIGASMEQRLYLKLLFWGKRKLNAAKTNAIAYKKFWRKVDSRMQFAYKDRQGKDKPIALYRKLAKGVSLVKYVKVKQEKSVYDGDVSYWSRRALTPNMKTKVRARLLKKQEYKCNMCHRIFMPFDVIETDHITPIRKGGKHSITNLQLLHATCHDKKK